jgi:beta-lactamase regulating signal transducer with metallopeptidase domain
MENLLYYLLRASVSMALFYGFYKLFFSKNTFHDINRFLLIEIALLSALLPLFHFDLFPEWGKEHITENLPLDFSSIPVSDISGMSALQPVVAWRELLSVIFVAGFLFALVRYMIGLIQIVGIVRNSRKEKLNDPIILCVTGKDIAPFSWMHYIVLSGNDLREVNRAIIEHEQAHIHLYHSFDMIFFDLFTVFFWFNPFSWLLRCEIQSVHEYQADQQVLAKGIDVKQYQLLLIRKCVGEQKFALANNFQQRDLYKRIEMMMINKSEKQMKWRYVATFPLLFVVMVALSVPKLNARVMEKEMINAADSTSLISVPTLGAHPLYIVDGKEVKSISDIDSDLIEAVDVLKNSYATKKYGERAKDGVIFITTKKGVKEAFGFDGEVKPLLILDGEIQDDAFDLNSVSPVDIDSISVFKDQSAVERYGDKGKNGVIVITRKKKAN